eukprot:scaffold6894_cov104-Isochrysis_galbana.AAC.2
MPRGERQLPGPRHMALKLTEVTMGCVPPTQSRWRQKRAACHLCLADLAIEVGVGLETVHAHPLALEPAVLRRQPAGAVHAGQHYSRGRRHHSRRHGASGGRACRVRHACDCSGVGRRCCCVCFVRRRRWR